MGGFIVEVRGGVGWIGGVLDCCRGELVFTGCLAGVGVCEAGGVTIGLEPTCPEPACGELACPESIEWVEPVEGACPELVEGAGFGEEKGRVDDVGALLGS